jgi:hypothetical protein
VKFQIFHRKTFHRLFLQTGCHQAAGIDFHRMISILGVYPHLLRRTGLHDLVIPIPIRIPTQIRTGAGYLCRKKLNTTVTSRF